MMRRSFLFWLCLQSWPCSAQQPTADFDAQLNRTPKVTEENIQQATEILRDPTVGLDSVRQVLRNQAGMVTPSGSSASNLTQGGSSLSDPTQMTGSFTEALSRLKTKPGTSSASGAGELPAVRLVAKAIRGSEHKSAMLDVAGSVMLVRPGSKFSFQDEKDLYEIVVDVIEDDHVEVTLLPVGRKMILR